VLSQVLFGSVLQRVAECCNMLKNVAICFALLMFLRAICACDVKYVAVRVCV